MPTHPFPTHDPARQALEASLTGAGLRVAPSRALRQCWQDSVVPHPRQVQVLLAAPMPPPLDRDPRPLLVRGRFGELVVEVDPDADWTATVNTELILPHGWTSTGDQRAEDEPGRGVVWAWSTWAARAGSAAGVARIVAGLEAEGLLAHLPGIDPAG